ncbi:MAG: EAL domain-containing protein [Bacillota bacterium]|nr:EAL domain-containing protein [Bacillota bacterium]
MENLSHKYDELCLKVEELEKKLLLRESLYLKILDALPINVFLEDPEGRTIFANEQTCKMNGKEQSELIGKTVYDFFPPEIAEIQRKIDLNVWNQRKLMTNEVPVDFQGKESYMLTGKTIIHVQDLNEDYMLGFGVDITDRVRTEKLLKQSEERFRNLIEQAGDCLFLIDLNGQIINVNRMTCKVLQYQEEELLKLKVSDLFLEMQNKLPDLTQEDLPYTFEDQLITSNKNLVPVDINLQMVQINDSKLYLGLCRDISEKKKTEAEIAHMAYHDKLTDLPNRWYIESQMCDYLKSYKRNDKLLGIFLLDLDRFKVINDSFGHQAGDLLLQIVAKRLQKAVKNRGIIARFGGDEFILLVPNLHHYEDAFDFCEMVMNEMGETFEIYGQNLNVSTSIGISLFPLHGEDIHTLIKNADLAMYQAKEKGRNCYSMFTPIMKERAIERMDKEILLWNGLEHNEFILHYQPKVDFATGKIYGMETLIRWKDGSGQILYPDSFISIAEETGLIVPIGEWVLREACTQCKKWHDSGLTHLSVSVNISLKQFQKQDLENLISTILEETGLSPTALELELTESTIMEDPAYASIILKNLKALGIKISIDDFGTGFSSLSYLKQFPIDILKIDKSFIVNLEWDEANASIAAAVISLAHNLKLKVVAEGIETLNQVEFLKERKCDFGQGYLFSKPIELEKAIELIKREECLL